MTRKETTKYVAKVPIGNNKYRYFYDKKEYDAYLNNSKTSVNKQEKKPSIKSLINDMADKTIGALGDVCKKGEATVNKFIKSVDKAMSDTEAAVKKGVDKAAKDAEVAVRSGANKATKEAGKLADKVNKAVNDYIYKADKGNMYDMNSSTHDEKVKQVEQTKEWQDIVKRKDPEYVKKNKETGEYEYLIDDYILKKKHPILDIAEDLAYGRNVDTHEITKDSASAAVKDYIKAGIHGAQMTMAVMGGILMTKFKFQQGSYDEEAEALETMVENGKEELDKAMKRSQQMSESDVQDAVKEVLDNSVIAGNYDEASVEAAVKKAVKELEKQKR